MTATSSFYKVSQAASLVRRSARFRLARNAAEFYTAKYRADFEAYIAKNPNHAEPALNPQSVPDWHGKNMSNYYNMPKLPSAKSLMVTIKVDGKGMCGFPGDTIYWRPCRPSVLKRLTCATTLFSRSPRQLPSVLVEQGRPARQAPRHFPATLR